MGSRARRKRHAPRGEPLVHPYLVALAKRLKSRRARIDDTARTHPTLWSDKVVPCELVPFFKSLDVAVLVDAVQAHPWLYWHPLVRLEIYWLMHLSRNPRAWREVGWDWNDGERPGKVATVDEWLWRILQDHARVLLPHRRISWTRPPRESGPAGGIANPFPAAEDYDFIGAQVLLEDWQRLKDAVQAVAGECFGKKQISQRDKRTYKDLALKALKRAGPSWSSRRTLSPSPQSSDQSPECSARASWRDLVDNWNVDLDAVAGWLANEDALPKRVKKEGRAARVAYAVLAALLAADPMQVRDCIDNYRKTRQRRRRAVGGRR